MLNNNIGIDLHIHSKASEYKEAGLDCIKECSIENLDILFTKLSENNINMFSITDHNRFDKDLYMAINSLICEKKYPTVMSVLAGVEFDVLIDEDKPGCHIIVIFNANSADDYQKIVDGINSDKLEKMSEAYTIKRFLAILRKINLNTILIAHQKSAFDNQGNHKSFGDATDCPEKYLCYIDALEYNKSRTEGIVRDSLEKYETVKGLVKGSDCHDWEYYPRHNRKVDKFEEFTLRIRALPTFKGLLMALSSPDTRFNRSDEQEDKCIIDCIKIGGKEIKFSSGINAIIGENGSGKSSILKILKRNKEKYLIAMQKDSQIECHDYFNDKTTYIEQSQLVKLNNNNELFKDKDYYNSIDLTAFNRVWTKYNSDLLTYLKQNIEIETLKDNLPKKKLELCSFNVSYFYINFIIEADFTKVNNPYSERLTTINEIIRLLEIELKTVGVYSSEQLVVLNSVYKELLGIKGEIGIKSMNIETDKKVRSIIYAKVNEYKNDYDMKQTTASRDKSRYTDTVNEFINAITGLITKENSRVEYPKYPEPMPLAQSNTVNGFIFVNQSEYNDVDLKDKYFGAIFNKGYSSDENLKSIRSITELVDAVKTASSNYEEKWMSNFFKFLEGSKKEKRHMYSADEIRPQVLTDGSTLGELSLAYYQFITYNQNDLDLLVIDQPEDNISNTNIANHLIKFMNRLRDKVQIIFVTHNPLLVVNLDVDNVICLNKHNGKITAQSGCLEHGEILECVSENMDGGKEKIEKRLKIYG